MKKRVAGCGLSSSYQACLRKYLTSNSPSDDCGQASLPHEDCMDHIEGEEVKCLLALERQIEAQSETKLPEKKKEGEFEWRRPSFRSRGEESPVSRTFAKRKAIRMRLRRDGPRGGSNHSMGFSSNKKYSHGFKTKYMPSDEDEEEVLEVNGKGSSDDSGSSMDEYLKTYRKKKKKAMRVLRHLKPLDIQEICLQRKQQGPVLITLSEGKDTATNEQVEKNSSAQSITPAIRLSSKSSTASDIHPVVSLMKQRTETETTPISTNQAPMDRSDVPKWSFSFVNNAARTIQRIWRKHGILSRVQSTLDKTADQSLSAEMKSTMQDIDEKLKVHEAKLDKLVNLLEQKILESKIYLENQPNEFDSSKEPMLPEKLQSPFLAFSVFDQTILNLSHIEVQPSFATDDMIRLDDSFIPLVDILEQDEGDVRESAKRNGFYDKLSTDGIQNDYPVEKDSFTRAINRIVSCVPPRKTRVQPYSPHRLSAPQPTIFYENENALDWSTNGQVSLPLSNSKKGTEQEFSSSRPIEVDRSCSIDGKSKTDDCTPRGWLDYADTKPVDSVVPSNLNASHFLNSGEEPLSNESNAEIIDCNDFANATFDNCHQLLHHIEVDENTSATTHPLHPEGEEWMLDKNAVQSVRQDNGAVLKEDIALQAPSKCDTLTSIDFVPLEMIKERSSIEIPKSEHAVITDELCRQTALNQNEQKQPTSISRSKSKSSVAGRQANFHLRKDHQSKKSIVVVRHQYPSNHKRKVNIRRKRAHSLPVSSTYQDPIQQPLPFFSSQYVLGSASKSRHSSNSKTAEAGVFEETTTIASIELIEGGNESFMKQAVKEAAEQSDASSSTMLRRNDKLKVSDTQDAESILLQNDNVRSIVKPLDQLSMKEATILPADKPIEKSTSWDEKLDKSIANIAIGLKKIQVDQEKSPHSRECNHDYIDTLNRQQHASSIRKPLNYDEMMQSISKGYISSNNIQFVENNHKKQKWRTRIGDKEKRRRMLDDLYSKISSRGVSGIPVRAMDSISIHKRVESLDSAISEIYRRTSSFDPGEPGYRIGGASTQDELKSALKAIYLGDDWKHESRNH